MKYACKAISAEPRHYKGLVDVSILCSPTNPPAPKLLLASSFHGFFSWYFSYVFDHFFLFLTHSF